MKKINEDIGNGIGCFFILAGIALVIPEVKTFSFAEFLKNKQHKQ